MRNRYRPWFRDARTFDQLERQHARQWVPLRNSNGDIVGWETVVTYPFWRNRRTVSAELMESGKFLTDLT